MERDPQVKLWKRKIALIPTDLQLLDTIYERYRDTYEEGKQRPRNYVPIDIHAIAKALDVEPNSVFGRLYYHLQPKYGYEKTIDDRIVSVHFFDIEIGGQRHSIHFPLMMSVLAGLRREHRESQIALWTSLLALGAAATGLIVSLVSLVTALST